MVSGSGADEQSSDVLQKNVLFHENGSCSLQVCAVATWKALSIRWIRHAL